MIHFPNFFRKIYSAIYISFTSQCEVSFVGLNVSNLFLYNMLQRKSCGFFKIKSFINGILGTAKNFSIIIALIYADKLVS
jgi:hypothetical protein